MDKKVRISEGQYKGLYTLNNIPPSCIIDDNEVINTK